ncbi:MAG: four helix bundle protein [Akkermansia sp.]|nr:four helix bundle protein [Akkermansia sp.]
MRARTYAFALRILRLWKALPNHDDALVLGKQLLRCGTSVGANYRSACLAKSPKDFLNKIRICLEEADESCYWLNLLIDAEILSEAKLQPLLKEAHELSAIMTASANTAEKNIASSKSPHC